MHQTPLTRPLAGLKGKGGKGKGGTGRGEWEKGGVGNKGGSR